MTEQAILRRLKDAQFQLDTALIALRQDGPTPLVVAMTDQALRKAADAQALHAEHVG